MTIDTTFSADGVYAGIPYRVLPDGSIESLFQGRVVVFKTMEQLVSAAAAPSAVQEVIQPVRADNAGPGCGVIIGCTIGIAAFGFFVLVAIEFNKIQNDPRTVSEKLMDNCKKEFGPDEFAVNNCFIHNGIKTLKDVERERLDRAARGIR